MSIDVTDKQARFFLLLAKAGAFDILSGSVTIHVDRLGNPVKAETHQYTELSPTNMKENLPPLTIVL